MVIYSWNWTFVDLNYKVLTMSRKNSSVKMADFHKVNKVLEKVESKESEIYYGKRCEKEEKKSSWRNNLFSGTSYNQLTEYTRG